MVTPEDEKHRAEDNALKRLDIYVGVYKHHFELFLKGVALYLAINGSTAAYLYRDGSTPSQTAKAVLSLFLALVSALALGGCVVSLKWVSAMDRTITRLSQSAGVEPLPLNGARGIVTMVMFGAMVVLALAVYNVFLALRM